MDRTPVRGPKSREVTKEAKRRKKVDADKSPAAGTRPASDGGGPKSRQRPKAVDRAIARATVEVVEPKSDQKSRRRRGSQPPSEPVNEPLAFITFIAAHPLGSQVIGTAVEYSSHGAFVEADGARCYIPLSAMAEPPPRRAREVVAKGEDMTFIVQAFDPPRVVGSNLRFPDSPASPGPRPPRRWRPRSTRILPGWAPAGEGPPAPPSPLPQPTKSQRSQRLLGPPVERGRKSRWPSHR